MEFDQWHKTSLLTITLVLGGLGLWISIKQFLMGRRGGLREEYKFAKNFLDDLANEPNMHIFARQKGFQAIAGDPRLPTALTEHILKLSNPVVALQDYVFARGYLKFHPDIEIRKIDFRSFSSKPKIRKYLGNLYFTAFLICYLIVVSPYFFWAFNLLSPVNAAKFFVVVLPFLLLAIWAARENMQLRRAEKLVEMQLSPP